VWCRQPGHTPLLLLALILLFVSTDVCVAQSEPDPADSLLADTARVTVAPPTSVIVTDHKYDNGDALELSWVPSIDDRIPGGKVVRYQAYRSVNEREYRPIQELLPGSNFFLDESLHRDSVYSYYVTAYSRNDSAMSVATAPVSPQREWLHVDRAWLFVIALVISLAVFYYIRAARKGEDLFIRKIAGLEAVDEAIGRATEMGRPILYIPGILDMDDVQTLAAITILGRVARTVADYEIQVRMPVSRSLVMTAARETIKTAYQTAGRPDSYSDDMVQYVTDEQFGYVAAVDGIMVRERPATVFLLGAFFAESLILAETGNSINAIQIAGTARPAQLPFFIAACDFTLIGEELFAASAYLSGEPKQLGSLKGQDVGKFIAMVVIIIGVIAATLAQAWEVPFMQQIYDALTYVFSTQ
jgi:hypothetical protein